jgi:hypothetical protein
VLACARCRKRKLSVTSTSATVLILVLITDSATAKYPRVRVVWMQGEATAAERDLAVLT